MFPMNSSEQFPLEAHKLTTIIIFLIISALSNWFALSYIHDFIGSDPLPDIVFTLIDEQPWATPVGDFMVTLSSVSLIFLFIFHKHRVVIVRRILFIISCLYALRTIMMLVTYLPPGYSNNVEKCRPRLAPINRTLSIYIMRTLEQIIHVGFQDNSKQMLCGDLLFSGHTLIMVIAPLAINKYIDKSFRFLVPLPYLFALIGIPCMVISRTHYTCDVLIAFLASKGIFTLYHSFCEIEYSHGRRRSILQSLFIIRVVSWLEENVCSYKIKNEFEIPFIDLLEQLMGKEVQNSNSSSTAAMEFV